MKRSEMSSLMREVVEQDTLDHWLQAAAAMMTGISAMRAIEAVTDEEGQDMLRRLSAIVTQGAKALGSEPSVSLDTFLEGAEEVQVKSAATLTDALEQAKKRGI